MKKVHISYLFISILLFCITSCDSKNDGPDPDIIWDFANYSIEFDVGNNEILNDEDSLSKIKISYDGKDYFYSKDESDRYSNYNKATYCFPLAVRCYNYWCDKDRPNTTLGFGEFRPDDNHKNKEFTIDWGNGRIDNIEFSIYLTWKKGNPTVHKKLKINGESVNFAPISIP